jgi:HK97 family phage major capsid protein
MFLDEAGKAYRLREETREQAQKLIAKLEDDDRMPTAEETRLLKKWEDKIAEYDEIIKTDTPYRAPENNGEQRSNSYIPKIDPSDDGREKLALPAKGKTYRDMFCGRNYEVSRSNFESFRDYIASVAGGVDKRLARVQVEGTPELGGFAVPEEYAAFIFDVALESEIIRPRATVWALGAPTRKIPAFDSANHTDGLLGGLSADWLAEGEAAKRKTAKLRLMTLNAHKLACFTQISNELAADGMRFEEQLLQGMVKGVGWYLDYYFIHGTGAGQPLGILNDPALIVTPKDDKQANGTLTYNNVVNMFSRLAPGCFKSAVWIANPTIIPQLLTMSFNIGTAGSQVQVFKEESGKYTILGKEVVFTEKCPALGNKGDIMLCDLTQYAVGVRKEIALDRSIAPGWLEDLTDFRAIVRADGQGLWNKPITPKHGNPLSWCITLAAR